MKLSDLLSTREITANQDNLEKGKVWTVSPTGMYSCIRSDMLYCWTSPGCGTLTIEMWGAAGSGARMCCCGFGLPGNAPAYSKKTIAVFCGIYICACPSMSCNSHSLCFSGCSDPSYLRWGNARDLCGYTGGCMCAQGGRGGIAICSTSTSAYCCYLYCTFCTTRYNSPTGCDNCAIVCNQCPGAWIACGYGGDINCCGCVGYVHFKGCYPSCPCQTEVYIPFAAGVYSTQGGYLSYINDADPEYSEWSGMGNYNQQYAINNVGKWPSGGMPWHTCYSGTQSCGCYEQNGCQVHMPYGVAGGPPFPCPDVRDHGRRGGHGAIRLTYRGSGIYEQNCSRLGGGY